MAPSIFHEQRDKVVDFFMIEHEVVTDLRIDDGIYYTGGCGGFNV